MHAVKGVGQGKGKGLLVPLSPFALSQVRDQSSDTASRGKFAIGDINDYWDALTSSILTENASGAIHIPGSRLGT